MHITSNQARLGSTNHSEVLSSSSNNPLLLISSQVLRTLAVASMFAQNRSVVELQANSFTDSFDIKSFLGQGAFASVCKCVEKASGKEFAAKIVRFTKGNQDELKKVVMEAEVWRTVQHKNIISLYQTFLQENEICIVMELIEGKTLFEEIVGQTYFSEIQACYITYQVSFFIR